MALLMYFTFFQEVFGILAQYLGLSFISQVIPTAKYIIIFVFFIAQGAKIIKDKDFYYIFLLIFIVLTFVIIIIGKGDGGDIFGFFLKIAMCIFLFFIGKYIHLNQDSGKSLDRLFVWLSVLTVISGLFDYFYVYLVTHDELLRNLKIGDYFSKIKNMDVIRGLPGNLYGSFSSGWFSVRRVGGLFFVPLTFAYYGVFLLYYQLERNRRILVTLLFITILLTFTRTIIIPVVILLAFHFFQKARPAVKLLLSFLIGGVLLCSLVCFYSELSTLFYQNMFDGSGRVHMGAINEGMKTAFINMDSDAPGVSEGVWWTMSYFGGIFIFLFFIMLLPFFKAASVRPYLFYSWVTYLLTSIFSVQLFSPTSVLFFWFVLGIESNKMFMEYSKDEKIENRLVNAKGNPKFA
jgi:hypothetical protein